MFTVRRTLAAVAVALGLLLAFTSFAAAAQPAGGPAYVRLAHLSPDTPNVDVYVGSVADPAGSFVVPGIGYGAVSPYQALPPGTYVISMRGAGAPADSPAVISTSVDVQPGGAYTIAGLGMSAALELAVLTDRLDIPPAGQATVRVVNGAASAPVVDVGPAGGPTWATGVQFGTDTEYADVPLGGWTLRVTGSGVDTVALPVQLEANSVYTCLLVDRDGELVAELILDSAGSAVVPVGGVETGFGGTAVDPGLLAACALAAALAGGLFVTRVGARRARAR